MEYSYCNSQAAINDLLDGKEVDERGNADDQEYRGL